MLAIPRANRAGQFYLTRPATGLSPFEEDQADLRRKYEKITPEQTQAAWDAAYSAAYHENAGGRLSHIQMLSGSTLPLLPLLEGLVKKHAPLLSRSEQAVAAVRVQLDGTRLVGVRFPRRLMPELRIELLAWQQQRGANGSLKLSVDAAASIDEKELARALRPPKTISSFFAAPTASPAAASSAPIGSGGQFASTVPAAS